MPFKINISYGGKTFQIESGNENFIGKKIGSKFFGNEISNDFQGYEFEISGTSDIAGFPGVKSESGNNLRKIMLTKGKFFYKVNNKGIRKKKTVRGNEISLDTRQINSIVTKEGSKKLADIFNREDNN